MLATTASPIAVVDTASAFLPSSMRSPVRAPDFRTVSTAASIHAASASIWNEYLNIKAPLRICPIGFATFFPAMSGALPPLGSYMCTRSPRDADGIKPRDPGSTLAASERISPNMFPVAMTSKNEGFCIICIAALSTYMKSSSTSGKFLASSRATSRQSREHSRTFALSTTVTFFLLSLAAWKAKMTGFLICSTEYSITSKALSPSRLCSPK
mmetsp:Transcript_23050/g.36806  ORF Transcript_23050/g.36806 Transcript_23050/m.36806 type:complete len:212 (+) Transcript_23050:101-736(+)